MNAIRKSFLFLILAALPLHAFPPAPHYTLYGTVRDQVGQMITADGAQLVLFDGTREIGRTRIITGARLDQNYELSIRMDHNRGSTTLYHEKAIPAQGLFSLVVEMNGALFYPIEVSGNLTAGKGGERVRLDLNLGEDRDGDGLPDVWEQWQLYQAGYLPDENGDWDLSLIDRDGDLDGDGQSNFLEYIAGTFAGDANERFQLVIKERLPTSTRFECYGITGKTYTLESSPDMKTWTRIPFAVGAPGVGATSHRASDIGLFSAFAAPSLSTSEFYRLTVR